MSATPPATAARQRAPPVIREGAHHWRLAALWTQRRGSHADCVGVCEGFGGMDPWLLASMPIRIRLHKRITGIRWHRLAYGLPHMAAEIPTTRRPMMDWTDLTKTLKIKAYMAL